MTTATQVTGRFSSAVEYAVRMHDGHVRKGTTVPYISHPLAVASLILEAGGTEDQAIAGLLHDVPEDCGGEPRLVEIKELFGPAVAHTVRGCSDSLTEDRDAKAPWRERKEQHLAHLVAAGPDVIMVTAADKAHNAQAIWNDIQVYGLATLRRFNATPHQLAWYYASVLQVLTWRDASPLLLTKLARAVFPIIASIRQEIEWRLRTHAREESVPETQQRQFTVESPGGPRTLQRGDLLGANPGRQFDDRDSNRRHAFDTAATLLAGLPGSVAQLDEASDQWVLRISGPDQLMLAKFTSEGTFACAPEWDEWRWSSIKEGGPESVARMMLRDINDCLGRPELERVGLSRSWFEQHASVT